MPDLHLGCGDREKPGYTNVDVRETAATDQVHDLEQTPWPWADNSTRRIVAEHVFEHLDSVETTLRECARILRPGGRLKVVWPVGQNGWADPDHEHRWTWDTPEMYCGKRGWDADVGLSVVSRDISMVSHISGLPGALYRGLIAGLEWRQGQGRWLCDLPATSGEFTVVFER